VADFRWASFVPKQGRIDATAATKVDLATLTADAKAAHPFDAGGRPPPNPSPESRPSKRTLHRGDETNYAVIHALHWNLETSRPPPAPAASRLEPGGRSIPGDRDIRSQKLLANPPLDGAGFRVRSHRQNPNTQAEQQAWAKAHTVYVSEPPAVALRASQFRFSRAQIMIPDPEKRTPRD